MKPNEYRNPSKYTLDELYDIFEPAWDKDKFDMSMGYDDEYECDCIVIKCKENPGVYSKTYLIEPGDANYVPGRPQAFQTIYRTPMRGSNGIGETLEFQSVDLDEVAKDTFEYLEELLTKEGAKEEGKGMKKSEANIEDLKGMVVSDGTMRSEDLIPKFLNVLKVYGRDVYDKYVGENPEVLDLSGMDDETMGWVVDELFDKLNEIAPEGYSFESQDGDGACYGFWSVDADERKKCEDVPDIKVGDFVEYDKNGKEDWNWAEVTGVNEDGTLNLHITDMDKTNYADVDNVPVASCHKLPRFAGMTDTGHYYMDGPINLYKGGWEICVTKKDLDPSKYEFIGTIDSYEDMPQVDAYYDDNYVYDEDDESEVREYFGVDFPESAGTFADFKEDVVGESCVKGRVSEGWSGGFFSRDDVLNAMDGGILNKDWKLEKRFGNWGCYVNQKTGRPLVMQVMVSQDRTGDWGYKPVTSDMGPVDTNIQAAKWLKPRLEQWASEDTKNAESIPDYEWHWIDKCLGKETANKDRKNLVKSLVKGDKIKLIDTVANGAVVTFIDMITPSKMRIDYNGREMSCKTSFIDHKVEGATESKKCEAYIQPVTLYSTTRYDDAEAVQSFLCDIGGDAVTVDKQRNGDVLSVNVSGSDDDVEAFVDTYKNEYGSIVKDCEVDATGWAAPEDIYYIATEQGRKELRGESKKQESLYGRPDSEKNELVGKYYVDIENDSEGTIYSSKQEFDDYASAEEWANSELEKNADDEDVFQASIYKMFVDTDTDQLDSGLEGTILKSDVCESKKSEADGDSALKKMQQCLKRYKDKSTGEIAADIRYDVAIALDMPADEVDDVMLQFGLDNIYIMRSKGMSPKVIAQKILATKNTESLDPSIDVKGCGVVELSEDDYLKLSRDINSRGYCKDKNGAYNVWIGGSFKGTFPSVEAAADAGYTLVEGKRCEALVSEKTFKQGVDEFIGAAPEGGWSDYWAMQQDWEFYKDSLCRDGVITQKQADSWSNPCTPDTFDRWQKRNGLVLRGYESKKSEGSIRDTKCVQCGSSPAMYKLDGCSGNFCLSCAKEFHWVCPEHLKDKVSHKKSEANDDSVVPYGIMQYHDFETDEWIPVLVGINTNSRGWFYGGLAPTDYLGGFGHEEFSREFLKSCRAGTDKCDPELVKAMEDYYLDEMKPYNNKKVNDLTAYIPKDMRYVGKDESKKSESLTLKQKELKDMVRYGEAEDITTISDVEAKELKKKGIETVGISRGAYGMNGALLRDNEGKKYVITARSSNLFYFV